MPVIKINNLNKVFGDNEVLKDINLEINQGEVVAIIGPSGSGKSTLLRCMNLLEVPTKGQVIFEGNDLTEKGTQVDKLRQKMGMVFQNFNLFPHKKVVDNIILAPKLLKKDNNDELHKEALSLLDKVGLKEKADVYPNQLSGGKKQRVAIARALALRPDILCFDEPTSALDPELTGEVLKVIKGLADQKMTMVIVTHEMAFARDVANHVIFMDDGRIVEQGTPDEVFGNTKEERTRQFLSRFNQG